MLKVALNTINQTISTFEDNTGVIRNRKSKKDRQYNGQNKKGQTMIYKTLQRKNQRSINTNPATNWGKIGCSGRVSSSCFTCETRRVTVKWHEHHVICVCAMYRSFFCYICTSPLLSMVIYVYKFESSSGLQYISTRDILVLQLEL